MEKDYKTLLEKATELHKELSTLRPLSLAETERLNKEFIVSNTYESNAIEGNTLTLSETFLVVNENITISGKPLSDHIDALGHKF